MRGPANHSLPVLAGPPYLAFGRSPKAFFRDVVGGKVGRNVFNLCAVKYCRHCVFYPRDMGERALPVIIRPLIRYIDNAGGVDEVVGRVKFPCTHQCVTVPLFRKLVVRRARDHQRSHIGNRLIVENGAECTWRKDVDIKRIYCLRRYSLGAKLRDCPLHSAFDEVTNPELHTSLMQQAAKLKAYVAKPLNSDTQAIEVSRSRRSRIADLMPTKNALCCSQ